MNCLSYRRASAFIGGSIVFDIAEIIQKLVLVAPA
jgi:hypothetical protein